MGDDRTLVVADSGPLIALAGAGCLTLLRDLFVRVVVPTVVRDEIAAPPPGRRGASEVLGAAWLDVLPPPGEPDAFLAGSLDHGEAAVIALARAFPKAAVLLDEKRGRRVAATAYRLEVVGTVGVLVRAKRAGLLPAIAPVLERIVANGYFLSPKLVANALNVCGE